MAPEFADWVTGKNLGFSHKTDGECAEKAHDLISVFVGKHPAITVVERADAHGTVCQFYPNKYGLSDNSNGDFDPGAKRYDKYWKRILRDRK